MKKGFLLIFCLFLTHSAWASPGSVVSAHPTATKIGMNILKEGGSAADAAVATALALSVLEPYNSGLGGGGFLLYYEAKTKKTYFLDYREMAPQSANADYYKKNPEALSEGIKSVAIPGFVMGMETIHKKWRKLSWPRVFQPAIDIASKGSPLSKDFREKLKEKKSLLEKNPTSSKIFIQAGSPVIKNEALAKTLVNLRTGGAREFYRGELAQKMVKEINSLGGNISLADWGNYRVYFRSPHEFYFRGYKIVSAPLPSSGGSGLEVLLRRATIHQLDKLPPFSTQATELIADSLKDYFEFREISMGDTTHNIVGHTTHLNVIDTEGNIASMTNTVNSFFGSGITLSSSGIVLNNEMEDFSLERFTANPIRPGARPLSSMAPTLVFVSGKPILVMGTPGGKTIPQNIYQTLIAHWLWKQPLPLAVARSKFYYDPSKNSFLVEKRLSSTHKAILASFNPVIEKDKIGNLNLISIQSKGTLVPFSDPRGHGSSGVYVPKIAKERGKKSPPPPSQKEKKTKQPSKK